jgi:hypothetical protein
MTTTGGSRLDLYQNFIARVRVSPRVCRLLAGSREPRYMSRTQVDNSSAARARRNRRGASADGAACADALYRVAQPHLPHIITSGAVNLVRVAV